MNKYYKYFVVLITTFLFACQTTQKVDDSMTTEEKVDALVMVDEETQNYIYEYFFDWKKSDIKKDQKAMLDKDIINIKKALAAHPDATLLLEGHADERGTEEYNDNLSESRAKAIAKYLIENGIQIPMTIKFYGHRNPRESGKSESAWSQNRRVDLVIETSQAITPEAVK